MTIPTTGPAIAFELYPTTTTLKGKIVDCIRIRAPRQKELLQKPEPVRRAAGSDDDMDDDIPF